MPARLMRSTWFFIALAIFQGFSVSWAAGKDFLTVAEVIGLPESVVAKNAEVVVRGVLTYHEPGHRMAFLQDETGAIYIHVAGDQNVSPGDYVEVRGYLDPGLNGRNIRGPDFDTNPSITRLSAGAYPEAMEVRALTELDRMPGAYWIHTEVDVKSVSLEGDRARLSLDGFPHVPVFIAGVTRSAMLPTHLSGLKVELEGVIADSPVSEKPLILQRQILIPGLKYVRIPADEFRKRFDLRESNLSDLRWLQEREGPDARARVQGVVTWVRPGEGFFLQRRMLSAWIQCATHEMPHVGQKVECAGKPSSYNGVGILTASLWRDTDIVMDPIRPVPLDSASIKSDSSHGTLGSIQGTLVDILRGPSEDLAVLQNGSDLVFSHLSVTGDSPRLVNMEKGSLVSSAGTLLNRPSPALASIDTHGAYHFLLREPGDMRLIAAPPFWTHTRLLIVLCAVLAAALLASVWGLVLRRKVRKQADIIRNTVARQVVEEERVRIAREWHDSFEQHFAGLTMLLDAAAVIVSPDSPAGDMLDRAAKMADHSRSEARQAIWDLRSHAIKSPTPFAVELEEALRQAWPMDAECQLLVDCRENVAILPRSVALHLLRVAHEAVTNALKHAHCGRIRVEWSGTGESLSLSVSDDGTGLPQGASDQASQEGHFGLLGMRERALRLQGTLEILSPPPDSPCGTLIRISIPKPFKEP